MLIKEKFQFKLLNKFNFDLFLQKHITWKNWTETSESYIVEVLTVDTIQYRFRFIAWMKYVDTSKSFKVKLTKVNVLSAMFL